VKETTDFAATLTSVLASSSVGYSCNLEAFKDVLIVVVHKTLTPVHVMGSSSRL
jgi:hypothetical protein